MSKRPWYPLNQQMSPNIVLKIANTSNMVIIVNECWILEGLNPRNFGHCKGELNARWTRPRPGSVTNSLKVTKYKLTFSWCHVLCKWFLILSHFHWTFPSGDIITGCGQWGGLEKSSSFRPGGHLQDKLTSTSGSPFKGSEFFRTVEHAAQEGISFWNQGIGFSLHTGKYPSSGETCGWLETGKLKWWMHWWCL